MTDKQYYVRGCTALLDAVGTSIKKIENVKDALDSLYDSQTNYISQLKKEKVIYITASHKKSTGYNDMGFNVNVYIESEYSPFLCFFFTIFFNSS